MCFSVDFQHFWFLDKVLLTNSMLVSKVRYSIVKLVYVDARIQGARGHGARAHPRNQDRR